MKDSSPEVTAPLIADAVGWLKSIRVEDCVLFLSRGFLLLSSFGRCPTIFSPPTDESAGSAQKGESCVTSLQTPLRWTWGPWHPAPAGSAESSILPEHVILFFLFKIIRYCRVVLVKIITGETPLRYAEEKGLFLRPLQAKDGNRTRQQRPRPCHLWPRFVPKRKPVETTSLRGHCTHRGQTTGYAPLYFYFNCYYVESTF